MKNMIIAHNGSVQNIPGIPERVKAIYKTVWEISQKKVLDLAADRGAFICQSQSLNIHLQAPTLGQLTSMHFYGWKKGLKTGMYYLRTRPAAQAIQFTVDQSVLLDAKKQQAAGRPTAPSTTANGSGLRTPVTPSSTSPVRAASIVSTTVASSSSTSSAVATTTTIVESVAELTLDEKTRKAAEADPEFAAALQRQKERELEDAKLQCSIENKEACLMCSG